MIIRVFDAVARRRRLILSCAVPVAAGQAVWTARDPNAVIWWPPLSLTVLSISLMVLSFPSSRPARFVVQADPPAFMALPRSGPVFLAINFLLIFADQAGRLIAHARAGAVDGYDVFFISAQVFTVAVLFAQAWTGYDVSIRPDGLHSRRGITGTLIVPWQAQPRAQVTRPKTGEQVFPPGVLALPDEGDKPTQVNLTYRHPELVHTRGLTRGTKHIATENVDVDFLAAVINFYTAHPQQHCAIGTDHGYRHLQQALAHDESGGQ